MNGLLKISLPATKAKILGLSLLAVFIFGLSIIAKSQNQIRTQEDQIASLQKTIQENTQKISSLTKTNESQSVQIESLISQPTPTPIVEYRTNTVTQTQYVPQVQYVDEPAPQTQIRCTDNGFTGLLHQMNCTSY